MVLSVQCCFWQRVRQLPSSFVKKLQHLLQVLFALITNIGHFNLPLPATCKVPTSKESFSWSFLGVLGDLGPVILLVPYSAHISRLLSRKPREVLAQVKHAKWNEVYYAPWMKDRKNTTLIDYCELYVQLDGFHIQLRAPNMFSFFSWDWNFRHDVFLLT